MATPPVQGAGSPVQSAWTLNAGTTRVTPSVATVTGDLIVVIVLSEDSGTGHAISNSGTAQTWTQRELPVTTGNNSRAYLWTATASASQTITFTTTAGFTNKAYGIIAWVWRTHGGLGDTIGGFSGAGTQASVNAVTAANSTFVAGIADWSASAPAAGAAKYRTNIGAFGSELVYATNVGPGNYSAFVWHHPDTNSGTNAVGATVNMTPTLVGAEILGTAGAAAPAALVMAPYQGAFQVARYAVGGVATIAGTAVLPFVSIYSTATVNPRLREVHVFNTTATGGFVVALCRLTTTGTQGTALPGEVQLDATGTAASVTGFAGHTVAPTLVDLAYRKRMGAAIGDGVIWTFNNDVGITCAVGTGNGLGLYVPTGTGQVCDYVLVWDE